MRIIQILHTHHWSAVSNYCVTVSERLSRRGHKLLIMTEPGKAADRAKKLGLDVDELLRLNQRDPAAYLRSFKHLKRTFRKFQPNIIAVHKSESAWVPSLAARKYAPEAVVVRVRTDPSPPKGHAINRYVHKAWTDHIIAGSNMHKKDCCRILDYPAENISLVYGGVDSEKFNICINAQNSFRQELEATENTLVIGMLARLDRVKGHEYAIEALKIFSSWYSDFKFVAIGYENERSFDWLKKQAKIAGIADKLYTFGYREDLPAVLNGIDIGLLASKGSEANSRALLEFMATGKPVLATRVGVIPEILSNDKYGMLVEPQCPEQMAKAMLKLAQDPMLRQSIGKEARKRIEQKFSIHKFADAMESVFYSLL